MPRATTVFLFLIAGFAFVSLPSWANDGVLFLVGLTLIEALFSLSWNLLFGFAGLATFGHAGFFSIGAYLVAVAFKFDAAAPFIPLLLCCGALGAIAAFLVGMLALRRTGGIQLAILTLALSEVLHIVIPYSNTLGGADGISAIARPRIGIGAMSVSLSSSQAYYWFLCVVCGLIALCLWWLVSSRFGRVLRCIRQDPERTAFLGVDVARYRLWTFVLSGAIAAIAGGLSAPWTQIVTPEVGSWVHSTKPVLNSLLGGAGFFWGPVLGAAVFTLIDYSTRTLAGLSEIVVGLVLMVVVLGAPGGILGYLAPYFSRLKRDRGRAVAPDARAERAT
jgi:branched-chain amino acid transport system permease protein